MKGGAALPWGISIILFIVVLVLVVVLATKKNCQSDTSACVGLKMISKDPKIQVLLKDIDSMRHTIQHDVFCDVINEIIQQNKESTKDHVANLPPLFNEPTIDCSQSGPLHSMIKALKPMVLDAIKQKQAETESDETNIDVSKYNSQVIKLNESLFELLEKIIDAKCNNGSTTMTDIFKTFQELLKTICPDVEIPSIFD